MAYYATVQDAGRSGFLAGPFTTHGAAMAAVPAVKEEARKADPWSHFYAFGTARVKSGRMLQRIGAGKLNARLGYPSDGTRIGQRLP